MPTKPRQTVIYIDETKLVLSDYYKQAKTKAVDYQVFRDRMRSLRDRTIKINYHHLERAIATPKAQYQKYSGSGRSLSFEYLGQLFPELVGRTFTSIKSFMYEVGLGHLYSRVKNKRKVYDLTLDELIETVQSELLTSKVKKGTLYRITHIKSGMKYYGLTRQKLSSRWKQHCNSARKGSLLPLHCAIRENHAASFHVESVKTDVPLLQLADLEKKHIDKEQTQWPNGLNACSGGQIGSSIESPVKFGGKTFNSQSEFGDYVERTTNGAIKSYVAISRLRAGQKVLCKQRHHSSESYAGTPLYRIWRAKLNKGLLCERWKSFELFCADIGAPDNYSVPHPGKSFCRSDNKAPFGPKNYRWMTRAEASARLTARSIEYGGKRYSSFAELSRATGIAASTLIRWAKRYPETYESLIKQAAK